MAYYANQITIGPKLLPILVFLYFTHICETESCLGLFSNGGKFEFYNAQFLNFYNCKMVKIKLMETHLN